MDTTQDPLPGINSWLEDELRQQYRHDRGSVDPDWKYVFEGLPVNGKNGASYAAAPAPVFAQKPVTEADLAVGEELLVLRGAPGRIAENMGASVSVPLATSQRIIPVKVIEENRRLINHHRGLLGRSKLSYTHIIGWAVVRAVKAHPGINDAFAVNAAAEPCRIIRKSINFGLAVDVAGKNGARSLVVPNIKNAGALEFSGYMAAFDDLVARARTNKLTPADFQGTSISLTNPGTVGTMSSSPRLMTGQGAIIAVGAMDYPAEYRGVAPEAIAELGISKVMSVTSTYDHRIIQGAESGAFLGTLQSLLDGGDCFYEEIFAALAVPYPPVVWATEKASPIAPVTEASSDIIKQAGVVQLIHAYRSRGHLMASLDPLGSEPAYHEELDPLRYGLSIWDLDRHFYPATLQHVFADSSLVVLRDMIEVLRATYCGKIGCEYTNIQRSEEKLWLQQQMEPHLSSAPLSKEAKLRILYDLLRAEEFEHFLDRRFIGQKRFSLEGAETAVAILSALADLSADGGVEEIYIGCAHRGRLNILANIIGKPLGQIFSEFEYNIDPNSMQGSGDVKYHLGADGIHKSRSGNAVKVSLAANPSHLEAVNPVVEGMARARQEILKDAKGRRILPLLIHGDAAFAGQGVVAETLNLSQLDGYSTGGTIHLVINNQIGFTTEPESSRSTAYATDVARMVQAPIFHVNGDDPEAAVRVLQLAFEYRQKFGRDVVIDMICYRRHGHNETDDPAYTQPVMYRKIQNHSSVAVLYGERMTAEKLLPAPEVAGLRKTVADGLNAAFDATKAAGKWVLPPVVHPARLNSATNISHELLQQVVGGITAAPADFHVHPKLEGFLRKRRDGLEKNAPIDWGFGEAIAFGSLVLQGTPVRLSGQDCGRGTFSQRHLVLYDFDKGNHYVPLEHMAANQARFEVLDSSLSEYAVLGFEYGYSVAHPQALTMWEAQFGDFSNGAQIVIDQFITTAEQKWSQMSGLVMLLPHGYEGQGPEHSSARMERFLALCAEENIRVANCTTPAQYFHILRRQTVLPLKPLVIFTPKSLLRSAKAVSAFSDLTDSTFQELIPDNLTPAGVRKIVFCTGKVYYDLLAAREARKATDVALIRLEQLYPMPYEDIKKQVARYQPGIKLVWCQEEPRNMGAWRFLSSRLRNIGLPLEYVGRTANASPAAGSSKRHAEEQQRLVEEALA
jgi:2-oxoglutarate dehydrogenase E1 component